jgi:hypothetical protein
MSYQKFAFAISTISVADPGSGLRCLFDPRIRAPGWVKNQDPDPGMNNPDHISETLGNNFLGLKNLK